MLYKRPMFKMGGSPTGIETLEPRKKFQFGTSQFSFLEPGKVIVLEKSAFLVSGFAISETLKVKDGLRLCSNSIRSPLIYNSSFCI